MHTYSALPRSMFVLIGMILTAALVLTGGPGASRPESSAHAAATDVLPRLYIPMARSTFPWVNMIVTPQAGATVNLPDWSATIIIPSGASDNSIRLIYSPSQKPAYPYDTLKFANHAFRIDAYDLTTGDPLTQFKTNYTLIIRYNDNDWKNAGIALESLIDLYWREPSGWTGQCQTYSTCGRDDLTNELTVGVNKPGDFALMGP
jgi:hypothetical protein